MTRENLWSVQLSSKPSTLTLTLAGGRPFKISLTEPLLMCSTAASIEDKKNLHKNETCSINTDYWDHYNNHHTPHVDQFTLLVSQFGLKNILDDRIFRHTVTLTHFMVFWSEFLTFCWRLGLLKTRPKKMHWLWITKTIAIKNARVPERKREGHSSFGERAHDVCRAVFERLQPERRWKTLWWTL